jgi:hypothetical protein
MKKMIVILISLSILLISLSVFWGCTAEGHGQPQIDSGIKDVKIESVPPHHLQKVAGMLLRTNIIVV